MDIGNSVWNENDTLNNTPAPDGAPEGMFPSGVNDTIRADRGAIKRWYNWSIPKVTGGTSTAYTLSYDVAPGALADGMSHVVQFNAVNGPAPTLNVNALGAIPLHFYGDAAWGAWPANMVAINQIVRVTYNAAAAAYRAIGMPMALNQSVSGVTVIDFTGIPSNVNNIRIAFDLIVSANNANVGLQFYDSGGSLDSGAHYYWAMGLLSIAGNIAGSAGNPTSGINVATGVSNSTVEGPSGVIEINNIQAVKGTQCNFRSNWLDQSGSGAEGCIGGFGARNVVGPITGVRIFTSSGTLSGRVTLW